MTDNSSKAGVLLLYPPATQGRSPHLALPLLQGFLGSHHTRCDIQDLNLECLEYFLRQERLCSAIGKIEINLQRAAPCDRNYRRQAERSLLYWSSMEQRIEDSLRILRKRNAPFPGPDQVRQANLILTQAFKILSTEFYPTRWSEESFVSRFDASLCSQLIKAVEAHAENPFFEFFNTDAVTQNLYLEQRQLVGISICYESQLIAGLTLAQRLRQLAGPTLPVILGGPMAMAMRRNLQAITPLFKLVSAIVYGDGQMPLLALQRAIEAGKPLHQVPGLILQSEEGVVTTAVTSTPKLNQLPRPQFEQFPLARYLCNHLEIPVLSEQGCYYGECAFCSVDLSPDRRFDSRRVNLMLDDIEFYHSAHKATHYLVISTALPARKGQKLAQGIVERGLNIKWGSNIRYEDKFTFEVLKCMRLSGCIVLNIGLESGSESMLQRMRKGFTIEQAKSFHQRALAADIFIGLYIMLGFPGESDADRTKTLAFLKQVGLDAADISVGQFSLNEFAPIFHNPDNYGIKILDAGEALSFKRDYIELGADNPGQDLVTPFLQHLAQQNATLPAGYRTQSPVELDSALARAFATTILQSGEDASFMILSTDNGQVFELDDELYINVLELADGECAIKDIARRCEITTKRALEAANELIASGLLKPVDCLSQKSS